MMMMMTWHLRHSQKHLYIKKRETSYLASCLLPDLLLIEFAEELLPRAAAAIRKLCSDVRLHVRPSSVPAKAVKYVYQHQSRSPETHLTKG